MNVSSGFLGDETKAFSEQKIQYRFDGALQDRPADSLNEFRQTVSDYSLETSNLASRTIFNRGLTQFQAPSLISNGEFEFSFEAANRGTLDANSINDWRANSGSYAVLNWKSQGIDDAVLNLDSTWLPDAVFQDIETVAGENYLLTFDHLAWNGERSRDRLSEDTNAFDVIWDGELIQRIRSTDVWQSSGIELTGIRDGLTRLEFREAASDVAFPGGDASGPLIDNVRLTTSQQIDFGPGASFEPAFDLNQANNVYPISNWRTFEGSPNYHTNRFHAANHGSHVHYLNASEQRDGIYRDIYVEAGNEYALVFDLFGEPTTGQHNELRVRWDNQWAATIHATQGWNSYSVLLSAETTGFKRLVFAEPGDIQSSNATGPVLDNVKLLRRNQTSDGSNQNVGIDPGFTLTEAGRYVTEVLVPIPLGNQDDELRQVSFDVSAEFDFSFPHSTSNPVEDAFNVYLVGTENPQDIILDNGIPGGALLSLRGEQAEIPAGLVSFNGTTVTIDVTSLSKATEGQLLFQLLNNDGDNGTVIEINNIVSEVFVDQESQPAFLFSQATKLPGEPLDLKSLASANGIVPRVDKLRFDSATRTYRAELSLENTGAATGRDIAAVFKLDTFPTFSQNVRSEPITLVNRTGEDFSGNPYINFRNAIPSGGLSANAISEPIQIEFSNPSLLRFLYEFEILVGGPNQSPVFTPVDPVTVMPGSTAGIQLAATDPDDDDISYALAPNDVMPTTSIDGSGFIEISPTPDQIGSYIYTVMASDGAETIEQQFTVNVVDDPMATTRISGSVLDVDGSALVGVPVALGDLVVATDSDGNFVVEFMGEPPADALEFRGNELPAMPGEYPFVAEKLDLLFGHDVYAGFNNVIDRPVYLPALDLAQADHVDGMNDTMVDATLVKGEVPAELFIAAETLVDDKGVPFVGDVSITEVPRDLTPAALPSNLMPDVVVTIQPGDMEFVTPAPLTLPNRAGYAAGALLDLWSINPETGDFEIVGVSQVSEDGSIIETIEGGVVNSSWHFNNGPREGTVIRRNQEPDCGCGGNGGGVGGGFGGNSSGGGQAGVNTGSEVELHSGAYREQHDLASYNSLGNDRWLTLHYNSQFADPRPIIPFEAIDVNRGGGVWNDPTYVASLTFVRGNFSQRAAGFVSPPKGEGTGTEPIGLENGDHLWFVDQLPVFDSVDLNGVIQGDLSNQPTGIYEFVLSPGLVRPFTNPDGVLQFTGTRSSVTGQITHVNAIESPFGAGWQLGGLQNLVENPDGTILLVDGNGQTLWFGAPENDGDPYIGPTDDFTVLVKNENGTYTRTMPDQSVFEYDDQGRVVSKTDRIGNSTVVTYTGDRLTAITDPVGAVTTFEYTNDRVSRIIDPASRETLFEYDEFGNLTRIVDPDQTSRDFEYDGQHRMVAEINKRGDREEVDYGFHGRVIETRRADGSAIPFQPFETTALLPPDATTNPDDLPLMNRARLIDEANHSDTRGNVTTTTLDRSGYYVSATDTEGQLPTLEYNADHLVSSTIDGRGNVTEFTYDDRGNITSVTDQVIRNGSATGNLFPGQTTQHTGSVYGVATADFNGDGILDIAAADRLEGVSVVIGNGNGTFSEAIRYGTTDSRDVAASDFNNDGIVDLVSSNSIYLGNGDGTFDSGSLIERSGRQVRVADIDNDGNMDLILGTAGGVFYRGLGDGTFESGALIWGGVFNYDIEIGHFNDDPFLDVAYSHRFSVAGSEITRLRFGNGDGTFSAATDILPAVESITSQDFNQDGLDDLAVVTDDAGLLSVLINDGFGSFVQTDYAAGELPSIVESTDLNNDGAADLIVFADPPLDDSVDRGALVFIGNGDGTFAPSPIFSFTQFTRGTTFGDFNGDEFIDLVYGRNSSSVILTGNGDGTFDDSKLASVSLVAGFGTKIAAYDLIYDGNGDFDIAAVNGFNDIRIFRGDSDGNLELFNEIPNNPNQSQLTIDDINGDGIGDLVTSNKNSGGFSIHFGNGSNGQGDGTFAPRQDTSNEPMGGHATGDFNGDGLLDIATITLYSDRTTIYLGKPDEPGSFEFPVTYDGAGVSIEAIDVNGDGKLDLVTPRGTAGVGVRLSNGDGTFGEIEYFAAGTDDLGAINVVGNDFNLDGHIDLAAVIEDTNLGFEPSQVSVLLGDGSGSFNDQVLFPVGVEARDIVSKDFNGDGIPDLATVNRGEFQSNGGDVTVLLGVGEGSFISEQQFVSGIESGYLLSEDLNHDGISDLVVGAEATITTLIKQSTPGETPIARSRLYSYDETFSQLTNFYDELGRQTIYEIDPNNGNRLSMTQVIGELDDAKNGETDDLVTTYTYTPQGQIDLMTDPLGRIMDHDYDSLGRLERITFAVGTTDEAFQLFEHDDAGNQTAFIDENGNRTEYEYDELNRVTSVTEADPDGNGPLASPVTTFEYDENGNLTRLIDGEDNTTINQYDELDRVIATISVNGLPDDDSDEMDDSKTRFEYDPSDNVTAVIDPNSNRTENVYDARNRLTQTTDPDGGVTRFTYGSDDNLLSLTDPNDNTTRFVYDARNRMIREIDPLEKVIDYVYDPVDNLVRKTDRNGRVTEMVYDDVNRQIGETWLATDNSIVNEFVYEYDKASNLTSVVDNFSSRAFVYDNRDRAKTVDNAGTPDVPNVVLDYTFDDVGNILSVAETIEGLPGATTTYSYDGLNRMVTTTQSGGVSDKRVDLGYNQIGQFASMDRFSDLSGQNLVVGTTYQYDDLNRLVDLRHNNGDSDVAFYEYEYDFASRITSINDIDGLTTYGYDDRDQLTLADRDPGDLRGDESYLYDANGNRLDSHLHGTDYVTGPANRLLSDGTYNYEYDDEGNMILRTDIATGDYREFEYDHRNRLTSATDFSSGGTATQVVGYGYDSLDRRVTRLLDADGNGPGVQTAEYYVYERENVVLDFIDADGSGKMEQPELASRYLFGPSIDQILASEQVEIGDTHWMLTDSLGTVRDIVNHNNTVNHIRYDSFGRVISQSSTDHSNRYLYTGREYDHELDSYYYRARIYDSGIGRFISEDPIRFESGDSNYYRYVANIPNALTDPFGLQTKQPGDSAGENEPVEDVDDCDESIERATLISNID